MKTKTKKKKKINNISKALEKIAGTEASRCIESAFTLMIIAEEEIRKGKKKYPKRKKSIHDSFLILCPRIDFSSFAVELYRNHCRELIKRIAKRSLKKKFKDKRYDTRFGTRAEVILLLYHWSLQTPLTDVYSYLYYRLFAKVFRNYKKEDIEIGKESIPGEAKEIYWNLKKRLRQEDRK
jgi:hypothetical protein